MKRGLFLRTLTGVAFAMFVAMNVSGQVQNADYAAISGDNATAIDSVTVGSTTRLYVRPDIYYHPAFVNPTWRLTDGFTWTWTVPAALGTVAFSAPDTNYVEVDWAAAAVAATNVTVRETAPLALGGCFSDTNVYVQVIAAPTVDFTAGAGFTSADLNVCEGDGDLADNLQATLTGIFNIQLDWFLEIATLDDVGVKDEWFDINKASLGAIADTALNFRERTGTQITGINALTYNLTEPAGGFTAIGLPGSKKSTVYTYSLNGVNDRISRKSDYLTNPTALAANWTWYDTTPDVVVIRVNPSPETGPIYHIPNTWNF